MNGQETGDYDGEADENRRECACTSERFCLACYERACAGLD